MSSEIDSQKKKLINLFEKISQISGEEDDELVAHWAKYLCILTSGYIENSIKVIIDGYTMKRSNIAVANFVSKQISSLTNLKVQKISTLLYSFNDNWGKDLEKKITEEQRSAVDSVIANRNSIAHGQHIGLTFPRMKEYFKRVDEVVELVQTIVN